MAYYVDETGIYEVEFDDTNLSNIIDFLSVKSLCRTPGTEELHSNNLGVKDNIFKDKNLAVRVYKICVNTYYKGLASMAESDKNKLIKLIVDNQHEVLKILRFFDTNEATKNL